MKTKISLWIATILMCLMSGCNSTNEVVYQDSKVVPSTYTQSQKAVALDLSIGRLKRMAILPPVMDYSPKDLRYTFRPINPDTDRKELMDEIAHYLEQWRDFDVKRFDVTEEADLKDSYSKFAQTLASWSEINQKVHGLPDELSRKLTEFGENQGVDGIMLIHGDVRYLNMIKSSVLGLATLTASMYADSMRGDKAYVQVDIFSVESPRRVWQSNAVLMNFGNHNEFSANESYGESLFGKMERALPDIYIRQKPVLEQSR